MTDCEQLQDKSFSLCHSSHFYSVNAKHDLQVFFLKKLTKAQKHLTNQLARPQKFLNLYCTSHTGDLLAEVLQIFHL